MNLPALFQGFTNVDEADIVFDLFRFYENAARDRELIGFIWPDTGMNGPFRSYLYAPTLFLGSYVLQVPVDVTMRLIPWLSVPVTGWFLYLAMRHLVGPYAAGWGILLFLGSVYFTVFNTLSVGEVWYTLLLSVSLYFLTRLPPTKQSLYRSLLFFALGLTVKYTFVLLFPVWLCWMVFKYRDMKLKPVDLISGGVIVALGFLPLVGGMMLEGIEFLERFQQLEGKGADSFLDSLTATASYLWAGVGPAVLVLAVMGCFGCAAFSTRPGISSSRRALVWGTGLSLVAYILVGQVSFRYCYPLILPFSLLSTVGIACLRSRLVDTRLVSQQFLSVFLCLVVVMQGGLSFSREVLASHSGTGSNAIENGTSIYKAAATYVLERTQEQDRVAVTNPASFYIFGNRQMVLNPIYETFSEHPDGTVEFLFRMRGDHPLVVDESLRYFIIPDSHFRRFEFPNALTQLLVPEAQFGDVGIYRNALIGEAPTPSSKPLPDYDLRSIVQGFLQRGMMAPTSDAN